MVSGLRVFGVVMKQNNVTERKRTREEKGKEGEEEEEESGTRYTFQRDAPCSPSDLLPLTRSYYLLAHSPMG